MNDLETRLDEKMKQLNEMLVKYNLLNKDSHNKYDWRLQDIECQLEVLIDLRNNQNMDSWLKCYKVDFEENEHNKKINYKRKGAK